MGRSAAAAFRRRRGARAGLSFEAKDTRQEHFGHEQGASLAGGSASGAPTAAAARARASRRAPPQGMPAVDSRELQRARARPADCRTAPRRAGGCPARAGCAMRRRGRGSRRSSASEDHGFAIGVQDHFAHQRQAVRRLAELGVLVAVRESRALLQSLDAKGARARDDAPGERAAPGEPGAPRARVRRAPGASSASCLEIELLAAQPALEVLRDRRRAGADQLFGDSRAVSTRSRSSLEVGEAQQRHAALAGAEELAGPAQQQVLARDLEAVDGLVDDLQPRARRFRKRLVVEQEAQRLRARRARRGRAAGAAAPAPCARRARSPSASRWARRRRPRSRWWPPAAGCRWP